MKSIALAMVLTSVFAVASCAQSLEQIVEQHHEDRLNASFSNKPLRHGAGDGIGSRNAHVDAAPTDSAVTEDPRLSLAVPAAASEQDVSKNR